MSTRIDCRSPVTTLAPSFRSLTWIQLASIILFCLSTLTNDASAGSLGAYTTFVYNTDFDSLAVDGHQPAPDHLIRVVVQSIGGWQCGR